MNVEPDSNSDHAIESGFLQLLAATRMPVRLCQRGRRGLTDVWKAKFQAAKPPDRTSIDGSTTPSCNFRRNALRKSAMPGTRKMYIRCISRALLAEVEQ